MASELLKFKKLSRNVVMLTFAPLVLNTSIGKELFLLV